MNLIRKWMKKRNYLHKVSTLDARLLDDIGLSHYDVAQMRKRPFWKY